MEKTVAATVGHREIRAWLAGCAAAFAEHEEALCELDAATGDADHGTNMRRGFAAVAAALGEGPEPVDGLLKRVGLTLVDHIGGSSGALYGTLFLRMAKSAAGPWDLDLVGYVRAWRAASDGVAQRGGVAVGDKTLYDALAPAVAAMEAAVVQGRDLRGVLEAAASAASRGAEGTASLVARRGRASYLGDRSLGHPDAGAHSMALVLRVAAATAV